MKILKFKFDAEVDRKALGEIVKLLSSDLEFHVVGLLVAEHLSKKLGVAFNYEPVVPSSPVWNSYLNPSNAAEILCDNDSVLVIQNEIKSSVPRGIFALGREEKSSLSVTAISRNLQDCDRLLRSVSAAIQRIILQPARSRKKVGYFVDENVKTNSAYLQQLQDGGTYNLPDYEAIDAELSKRLRQKEVRNFILRLIQSKVLTDANFSQEISRLSSEDDFAKFLLDGGFLLKETFIECVQNGQRLGRFVDKEMSLETSNIKCATCNRLYKEEKLYSAYLATEKLKHLLSRSRWMNVLVTEVLIDCGVPKEFIYWNVNFGADEIDIIAFVGGLPWAFELKDKEFSVTDAHHFNYRRSVIKPSEAVVVTSTFVSPDAKKVFADKSGAGATLLGGNPMLPEPRLIEGLNGLDTTLRDLVSQHLETVVGLALKRALGGIEKNISEIVFRSLGR